MLNNDFVKSNVQLKVNTSSSLLLLLLLRSKFPCSLKNGIQCLKRHYHEGPTACTLWPREAALLCTRTRPGPAAADGVGWSETMRRSAGFRPRWSQFIVQG